MKQLWLWYRKRSSPRIIHTAPLNPFLRARASRAAAPNGTYNVPPRVRRTPLPAQFLCSPLYPLLVLYLGYALAVLIGVSLGLLGGGGSTLAVPVLAYVIGLPAKQAIAASLFVVGTTSIFGLARHWFARNVEIRAALLFGSVSMVAAFAGAQLARFFSDWLQLTIFGVVMLAAAISMLRPRKDQEVERPRASVAMTAIAAAGVGLLTGIVGIGGGFLIVPSLVVFARLPMKPAVGTSLLVIAANSFAGFAGYASQVELPWRMIAIFTACSIGGVFVGSALVHRISTESLRRGFGVFLIVVALFVLISNAI